MMPTSMRMLRHAFLCLALAGCASSTPEPQTPEGIRVDRAPPPPGARKVRDLKAVDGHGCGIFGTLGTYEGAVDDLRAQARAVGADYVQVTDVKEPAATRECVEKAFTVTGVAYAVRTEPAPAPVAAAAATSASNAAAAPAAGNGELAGRGLLLGPTGCGFGSPAPGAARSLSFSARVPRGARLAAWIDRNGSVGMPEGIALEYEPAARRIALVRKPGSVAVSVGPEPFELDEGWHAWRVLRAPDRISVWLDEKLVLLHAAPAPSVDGGFLLEGERIEVSEVRVAAP
jgi:hypothetical protein